MSNLTKLVRYGFEELKFINSLEDIKIAYKQKLPFIIPRLTAKSIRETKSPLALQLEPTNHCNLECICCSRTVMKREKGYMDYELFKKIIDDGAESMVRRIHLYLHGESFLHPRIFDMISDIKSKKIAISIATNGMLLNRINIKKLLQSNLDSGDYITFSILGHKKKTHEYIMKKVNHETVVENFTTLIKKRNKGKSNGPIIETIFYKMCENEEEEIQFINQWTGVADHVRTVNSISRQFSDYGKKLNQSAVARKRSCRNLWERMTIFWNGDVTTCIADLNGEYVIGNLKNKSIKELWNHEKLLAIKESHKQRRFDKIKLCASCDW